jgi:hypothetical protein
MFATQIEACNRVDVRSGDRVEDVLTADAGASLLERVASDLVTGLSARRIVQEEASVISIHRFCVTEYFTQGKLRSLCRAISCLQPKLRHVLGDGSQCAQNRARGSQRERLNRAAQRVAEHLPRSHPHQP